MNYQLIQLSPLKVQRSLNGLPSSIIRAEGRAVPSVPYGYKYVEDSPLPEDPADDGFFWSRVLTEDAYTWAQAPLPATGWHSQPAWRVRAVVKATPFGAETLMDAVIDAIASIADPLDQSIAEEAFFGGNVLERNSSLLLNMAATIPLTDEELDTIFQQADAIEV